MNCEDGGGSETELVKLGGEVVVAMVRDTRGEDVLVYYSMSSVHCANVKKSACHVDVLKLQQHFCIVVMRVAGRSWPH